MRDDGIEMKLSVKRGKEIIAKIDNRTVTLTDEYSLDGQLVRAIVLMGVPIPNENRDGRWHVQIEDPDFKEAFATHLEQYNLLVE